MTERRARRREEFAIEILAGGGFTAPEAGALYRAVKKLPVDSRIDLVERVARSVSGPNGRNVRLSIEGFPPLTVGRRRGAALCAWLVSDRSAKVRLKLAHELGEVRWEGRVPLLKALAKDSDRRVRETAAAYLTSLGHDLPPKAKGKDNYTVTFHPAFASRCSVTGADGECEVYKQEGVHHLNRAEHPKKHTIRLKGGKFNRNITLDVHDPNRHIAGITVHMYGEGHVSGARTESETVEWFSVDNDMTPIEAYTATERTAESLPTAMVTRYTNVAFAPRADDAGAGDLSFALLVEAASAASHPVDLRVAAGKAHAMVLAHAHSTDFQVAPGTRLLRIPRNGDSQPAVFEVRASAARSGVVSLMVYDEFHLAGSIEVRLRAVETAQGLALEQEGTVVWRDPGGSAPVGPLGLTVQASLADEGTGRVMYHALFRDEKKGIGVPRLVPLGSSAEAFDAEIVQASLASLRSEVDEIEKGLGDPQTLGAGSAEEVMEGLRINFESAGRQLGGDILSPEVRALIEDQAAGSVVHWVIHDRALDAVPWELACDPKTGRPLGEDIVLVRMPVHGDADATAPPAPAAAEPAAGPARLLYVLGKGVGGAELFPRLKQVVKSAKGYSVETNFDGEQREPMNLVRFRKRVRGARVVHVLSHGVVKEGKGLYLSFEDGALGRVNPLQVLTFEPAPGALVFINACSSAAATFSPAGLTTFGWNFLLAGAGAYVGTLAPVTTELALRFAEEFFDAHLGEGVQVAEAIFRARQALKGDPDPTWMLYALYADLHAPAPPPN